MLSYAESLGALEYTVLFCISVPFLQNAFLTLFGHLLTHVLRFSLGVTSSRNPCSHQAELKAPVPCFPGSVHPVAALNVNSKESLFVSVHPLKSKYFESMLFLSPSDHYGAWYTISSPSLAELNQSGIMLWYSESSDRRRAGEQSLPCWLNMPKPFHIQVTAQPGQTTSVTLRVSS